MKFDCVFSDSKIIVLGAGMSGVSTAKRLKELGYGNIQILEASSRVGGRLMHENLNGVNVELGTLMVTEGEENLLVAGLNTYNVSYKALDYDDWIVRHTNGTDITSTADTVYEKYSDAIDIIETHSEKVHAENRPDFTMRSALLKAGWVPKNFLDDVIEYFEFDWLYGYDPMETSGKYAFINDPDERLDSYGDIVMITDARGYADILESVLNEVVGTDTDMLKLNKKVTHIEQDDDHVTVHTVSGENYTADYIVVTFSIGVLQSENVRFTPGLPEWKMDAIQQFQMAQYTNVYVQFNTAFWDDYEWIVYAGETEPFNIIMNMNIFYPGSNILLLEASNRHSIRIERLTDDQVIAEVVSKLQKIYTRTGITVPSPDHYKITRFSQDPLFLGAWSNWPPGFTKDSHDALIAPTGRIYYAGDYANIFHIGYLQASHLSGNATANAIDRCIHESECPTYRPIYAARGCRYAYASNYNRTVREDDGSCRFSCISGTERLKSAHAFIILSITALLQSKLTYQ